MGSCHRWLSRLKIGLATTITIVLFATPMEAQSENATCVCSPRVYDITLDFSRTCNDNSGYGTGVQETRCNIVPFDDPSNTDLVPQQVTLIDVSELGQNLQSIVGSQRMTGNYENGDTITISSVSNNKGELDFNNLPKAFQMSMIGVNAKGATIVFSALIIYSGSCDEYPVLLFGTSNGWALLTEKVGPHADLCPAADTSGSSSPAPSMAFTLPPISPETTSIPTVAPIAAESPSSLTPSSVAPAVSGSPIIETMTFNPSTAPMATAIPSGTPPVPDSPTIMPVVSRTIVPTATTTTLVPTQVVTQTNRPTTTREPLSTMAPIKVSTPTLGKKKKMVCSHIKENGNKNSAKASKSSSKGSKGSAISKGNKGSKNSKSGKGGVISKSSETSKGGKGRKSGKKGKRKRNKRRKKKKKNEFGNIWSRSNAIRRVLTEMGTQNSYFRVHDDVFQERVANFSINATIPVAADEEGEVYVAIYKEVFKDAECYEIDVDDEPSELTPAFSPLSSSDEPTSFVSSNSPVSISPMLSPSPTRITPSSIVPSVGASSISPTNATNTSSSSFDNLVLDRANMTGPLHDRSSSVNNTRIQESGTAPANERRRTARIHTFVILATCLGGSLLMSVLLIRWYGSHKPMWQIRIPSTSRSSNNSDDAEEGDSVESQMTDDKRMGV